VNAADTMEDNRHIPEKDSAEHGNRSTPGSWPREGGTQYSLINAELPKTGSGSFANKKPLNVRKTKHVVKQSKARAQKVIL